MLRFRSSSLAFAAGLLAVTGYAENTGMGWENGEKNSVGRAWELWPHGSPRPTASSGSAGRWMNADSDGKWLPLKGGSFSIGPRWQTPWYEIVSR
jgi:hypothetical protein